MFPLYPFNVSLGKGIWRKVGGQVKENKRRERGKIVEKELKKSCQIVLQKKEEEYFFLPRRAKLKILGL